MKTLVLATAGHVDHGKTSLVRALTGVETDQLAEEKRRGLTIGLGRAYRHLPDGRLLGIVDVPGHEKFISTMLAGVSGVDATLLVIAADDGPMPQTREHLQILDILGVDRGLVALTKTDLVDETRLSAVAAEIEELLAPTCLSGAPVLPVSTVTGEGLPAVEKALGSLAVKNRPTDRLFRLAVDRSFIAPGRGLVATGTVIAGVVRSDEAVLLHRGAKPSISARVRGIEIAGTAVGEASAGMRCAIDLAGADIERGAVGRGDWLVDPALSQPSSQLDIVLRAGSETDAAWNSRRRDDLPIHFHIGAADRVGRLAVLGPAPPEIGGGSWARVRLSEPVLAVTGDRVVLRDASGRATLGGGVVVDPFGPARGRARPERLEMLADLREPDDRCALRDAVKAGPVERALFARRRGMPMSALSALLDDMPDVVTMPGSDLLWTGAQWTAFTEQCGAAIDDTHRERPELAGLDRASIVRALPDRPPPQLLDAALGALVRVGALRHRFGIWSRPDHQPSLAPADEAFWARSSPLLNEADKPPPVVHELAKALGEAPEEISRSLVRIARAGRVVRIGRNRFVPPDVLADLEAALPDAPDGFTVAGYRDATGLGRNFAIEVLEFFDRVGVTRRDGDRRRKLPHTLAHSAT